MRELLPKTIITCAVTGNLTTIEQTPHLPVTPEQIADACLGAAEAGAAVVHIHVRDPKTAKPSIELEYYRAVVERIRGKNTQLVLNVTTGPGGRFVPSIEDRRVAGPGTTLLPPEKRVAHIAALKPDIATLDLNTMNSGKEVVINTPRNVRIMAEIVRAAGSKPEIELFDSGDIALMKDMLKDGSLEAPILCSIVMGVKYGFQPSPETLLYARNMLPHDATFTGIGIGRYAFPAVAQSYLAGGHVRIGLEDSVMIEKGKLAPSNAAMVEKARRILEDLGAQIANPVEAREIIGLSTRLTASRRIA
jgi:uncharacterized protein (DUF849 family)